MISVIGGSDCDRTAISIAEKLGEEIAKRGAVLVCGGRGGAREVDSRGAKRFEGLTDRTFPVAVEFLVPRSMWGETR